MKKEKIWYPCKHCLHAPYCQLIRGCEHWRAWFLAYWAELRRKYLC